MCKGNLHSLPGSGFWKTYNLNGFRLTENANL